MADTPPETTPAAAGKSDASTGEDIQAGVYQVLVDHELDREGGMVKIPQPRRKRKLFKEW